MYTQSHEDAGRDSSASVAENSTSQSTWRQLPPEATGTAPTAQPAYEENLQTVLEDSERHLDALWSMLNSQMTRLSSGYTPTTEAQSSSVTPEGEHTGRVLQQTEEPADSENVPVLSNNSTEQETISTASETEAIAAEASPMPYNFVPMVPPLTLAKEAETLPAEAGAVSIAKPIVLETIGDDEAEEITVEHTEPDETPEPAALADEADIEPIPMSHTYHDHAEPSEELTDSEVSGTEMTSEMTEPEAVPMPASVTALASFAEATAAQFPVSVETPVVAEVAQEAPRPTAISFPAVRVESAFRDNWMVVTAREAGGVTVLPTVTMRMQSQPNQSLQMRSTAIGEMPMGATPLVTIESSEEAGSDPAAMRVEIAYTADAPDMIFEVNSQSEDEVQITMSDQSGDLCASWEVSKQKGKYARAKATLSRQPNDPEVLIEIQRFREDADPSVWHSLLSFSVVPKA